MTEEEILEGSKLICEYLKFEKSDEGIYRVPTLFPNENNGNYMELDADAVGFHKDWNLLIYVFNELRVEIINSVETRSRLRAMEYTRIKHSFCDWPHLTLAGRIDLLGSWHKVVDLIQWYNSVKEK